MKLFDEIELLCAIINFEKNVKKKIKLLSICNDKKIFTTSEK